MKRQGGFPRPLFYWHSDSRMGGSPGPQRWGWRRTSPAPSPNPAPPQCPCPSSSKDAPVKKPRRGHAHVSQVCLYLVVNLTLNSQHIFLKEKYTGNSQKERKGILRLWYILWLLFWNGKGHEMTNIWPMFCLGLWRSQASTPHHPHSLIHQPARFIHPTTSSQPLSPKK